MDNRASYRMYSSKYNQFEHTYSNRIESSRVILHTQQPVCGQIEADGDSQLGQFDDEFIGLVGSSIAFDDFIVSK